MPVSSLSGALSTSIYFAAMLLLLGVLIPPVRTAYGDARPAASQASGRKHRRADR